MPAPHGPEVRRRAVELARVREKPISEIARDLSLGEVVDDEPNEGTPVTGRLYASIDRTA